MLQITFEFLGGPNDGKIVQGRLGEPSDAERHYLFSDRGRVGQRFAVASDYAIQTLVNGEQDPEDTFQRHQYIVTDRLEDSDEVWVLAEYIPDKPTVGSEPRPARSRVPGNLDGHLLIASPDLDDPLFSHAVVLILDHTEDEETLGVILNCPIPDTVSQLWEKVSAIPCQNQNPVHVGGADNGPVLILHTEMSAEDVEVAPGVFLAVEKESLEWMVHQEQMTQRLLLGTATWDAEQLEEELNSGDWLVIPATKELIFADPQFQWDDAIQEFGRRFYQSIGIRPVPDDASLN